MPQFALIPDNTTKKANTKALSKKKYARRYESINVDGFCQDLDKIDWDSTNEKDVDLNDSNFLHVFNQILDSMHLLQR